MASKLVSLISSRGISHRLILAPGRPEPLKCLISKGFHSLAESTTSSTIKWMLCQRTQSIQHSAIGGSALQRFGFSSTASPQPTEKEAGQSSDEQGTVVDQDTISQNILEDEATADPAKATGDSTPDQAGDAGSSSESKHSKSGSMKRRRSTKRTAFSDSNLEEADLSIEDLVKLVPEKEELLKLKHKEIEMMQEKVLRCYAEMENVIERTKREAENSKKYAIQNFAKFLLDVADNIESAISCVKDGLSKIDPLNDPFGAGVISKSLLEGHFILKSLLEGVEMTHKQLAEVFRKFGVEKFETINEHFDPNRHHAVFQIPDASKPPGTVAVVLKPGYMLYDRIISPAEVGVTVAPDNEADQNSS